ncbi:hypothetical protein JOB18_035166 [Solea senegalensis]|uniref:Uncharacterized protein n=1 Tax=Solea senegalensis TaxID=28829 RepID=A0AAV6RK98_SOLSE|nr:hypothetical protein JOB18_035166 [Solea senegalensis]KAG7505573.1 hypothetical protein JOB18_035166 [Solea senegalensis]KAG7505574.1 hypothetical protein JOB18_035166 [Solea senegalensis]KAG7505575.1 hypothetical protein JOB18_035166 [Solea senegalensis]KAG7505576.1 hypothetical protein JOB18_035166 [Solea senegalensis]
MLQYLKKIIRGNIVSPWAKKEDRVFILFEDDDQVDQVMHFLSGVVESPQTDKKSADPVASIIQSCTLHLPGQRLNFLNFLRDQ